MSPLSTQPAARVRLSWMAPLWGCVLGAAWQVTQHALWPLYLYQGLLLAGLVLGWMTLRRRSRQWVGALLWMAAAACCVALLCWQAPGVASSMMGGSPSLSAGGAVGTAAGAVFGAIGAGRMIMGAKNALTGGAIDKVKAAAQMPSKK